MKSCEPGRLSVSIPEQTLRRLLSADQLCAADLNCLDQPSRHALRRLCLESCMAPGNGADKGRHRRKAAPLGARLPEKDPRPKVFYTLRGHLWALFTAKYRGGHYCGESE